MYDHCRQTIIVSMISISTIPFEMSFYFPYRLHSTGKSPFRYIAIIDLVPLVIGKGYPITLMLILITNYSAA